MATSGSVKTTAYDSRYIEFAWSRKSYSIANNTTTISWTLTARGSGQYSQYLAAPFLVKIDGAQVYYSETRVTTTNGYQITSGEYTFKHNTDGSKSFSVEVKAAVYFKAYNLSGSGSFTLDSIPRAAKVTGFTWDNDEANPVVTISNPAGNNVSSLELYLSDDIGTKIATRTLTNKTATSYTMVLTDAERAKVWGIFNTRKTTKTHFYMKLATTIGGSTYTEELIKEDCVIINHTPDAGISIFNLDDLSTITGSDTTYIKYASDIMYDIQATAKKGATIETYFIKCGSYENNKVKENIVDVADSTITYYVVDTRGTKVTKTKTLDLVNYVVPTCRASAVIEMDGETTAKATITIEGNYFNGKIGVTNNQIAVKIKTSIDNEWSTYSGFITPTYNGNTYKMAVSFYELPYDEEFKYQCQTADLVMSTAATPEKTLKLMPVFDWSDSDFNFNVPVKFNGVQMKDYVVEQGITNNWHYRKWNSGYMECWRRLQITANVTNVWGSLYTSGALSATNLTYPYAFTETPILNVNLASFGSGGLIMSSGNNFGSATSTGALEIARGTQYSGGQYLLNYYAFGRYK